MFAKIDSTLGVEGPMARNVEDLALLFDAMVGEEPADPLSLPSDGTSFLKAARSGWKPRRVAVSRDLGLPPVDPRVADLVMAAARKLEAEGVIVEEAHPDLRETRECAQTLACPVLCQHEAAARQAPRPAEAGSGLEHREGA